MIPLVEAQQYVLSCCHRLEAVPTGLADALGAVIAESITAGEMIPPFPNTAVDGFAVRAADVALAGPDTPAVLEIVDTLAAGVAPTVAVEPGQAIRIMTGAPMPTGADAVVMVETTTVVDNRVSVQAPVGSGEHVRGAGDDLRPGDRVLEVDTPLGPGHLGVLASLGRYEVATYRCPRIGVFSTGDELIEGPQRLAPGQIRDTNRPALLAMCRQAGFVAVDLGLLPDDEDTIAAAVTEGAGSCDALLTSGGVSMGDYDYVKVVLDRLGDMRWMQVAIKPAKPLAFGVVGTTPVFGLPGNPVSSMVSFELFARPALRKMMGHGRLHRPRFTGRAGAGLRRRPDGKEHFARVRVDTDGREWVVRSAGGQGSHQLTAMADADALAVLPDGDGCAEGDPVVFFFLGSGPWDGGGTGS